VPWYDTQSSATSAAATWTGAKHLPRRTSSFVCEQ